MNVVGLASQFARLKALMKKKPCERCGLLYDPEQDEQCPRCGHLDQQGLERLRRLLARERKGISKLGGSFILTAAILFLILFVLLLV